MEIKDISKKYLDDIVLFNKIISNGKDIEDFKVDELIDRVKLQATITKEEVDETIVAKSKNDIVEYYDGLADVVFTALFLTALDDVLIEKWDIGEGDLSISDYTKELGDSIVEVLLDEDINIEVLDKCVELVVENNKQKFTTSKEDFESWESDFVRKELFVDGVTYYTLVDNNGKIRKRNNFPKVDLSFVLEVSPQNTKGGTNNNDKV